MMPQKQRGALFGLDARIALAIFALLGIITGAVLYKVSRQIKVNALITQAQAYIAGLESFMVDTGTNLAVIGSTFNIQPLFTSSLAGWNGPYINGNFLSIVRFDGQIPVSSSATEIWVGKYSDSAWAPGSFAPCSGTGDCFYWLLLSNMPDTDLSLYEDVDQTMDNGDGFYNGAFRFIDQSGLPDTAWVAFRGPVYR